MDVFENIVDFLNAILWGSEDSPLIFSAGILGFLLIITGIYMTVRMRFIQVRKFPHFFRVLFHSFKPEHSGGISPFEAFATSLAARVGAGNIGGVAIAITLGGPGAVFWMWVIALMGMATAMVEATLAQVFKHRDETEGKNLFRGGPAYYMERGLNARWMGILFSIFLLLAFPFVFNALQANTLAVAMDNAFSVDPLVTGIVTAVLAGFIIFGGIKRIARFAEIVVPAMAIAYLAVGLVVVFINIDVVPETLGLIVRSAFGMEEVVGGFAGYAISQALVQGIKRGLFSNEAGLGSAPNTAATADIRHPGSQGFIQSIGVFIDTVVVCTTTALIILLSGVWQPGRDYVDGVVLTQDSLSASVGSWGGQFVAIALIFFAFTSIVANYYYGETSILFMKGDHRILIPVKIAVIGMVIFGSQAAVPVVWDMADAALGLMAMVNLVAILLLSRIAFRVIADYEKQIKEGVDPLFHRDDFPDLDGKIDSNVWIPDREERSPT